MSQVTKRTTQRSLGLISVRPTRCRMTAPNISPQYAHSPGFDPRVTTSDRARRLDINSNAKYIVLPMNNHSRPWGCTEPDRAPMLGYRGHFEVHLTVRLESADMDAVFQTWCRDRKTKYVQIVLDRGTNPNQPMATWRRSHTVLPTVLAEAELLASELESLGVSVVRLKIEVDPQNENVPATDDEAMGSENYFEHHVKLRRSKNTTTAHLLTVCFRHGAHLSRNAFRDHGDHEERFVTLRGYRIGAGKAAARLLLLLDDLRSVGETVLECESEYCVYDTNLQLDTGWLSGPSEQDPSPRVTR